MAESDPAATLPLSLRHLLRRLQSLNRDIVQAVKARRETTRRQALFDETDFSASAGSGDEPSGTAGMLIQIIQAMNSQNRVCISDGQVDFLISEVEALCQGDEDGIDEKALREEAKRQGIVLPLDRLEFGLPLSPTQMDALILCAAPECDQAYENLYAFILNDVTRRYACPELFCELAPEVRDRVDRRLELGRFGRLRLLSIVIPHGTAATDLRQEFRLAPGLFDFLLDGRGDPADLCQDPDEVNLSEHRANPPQIDSAELTKLGKALHAQTVQVVGVWGPRQAGPDEVALALAKRADLQLRRWVAPDARAVDASHERTLRDAIQLASVLDATLWIQTDAITDPGVAERARLGDSLAELLAGSRVRVILSGTRPWQPTRLLAARPFHAIHLELPDAAQRRTLWQEVAPGTSPKVLDDLAARFPVNGTEAHAAAGLAATAQKLKPVPAKKAPTGAIAAPPVDPLVEASAALDRMNSSQFTTLIEPVRGPEDLVLAEPLKTQVLEIAEFHRHWPEVRAKWGFGRMMTGPGGIKALFTGDPGTGKTLAAEVIAKLLGRPLLKLDLSRVVSKWVGETEKHLDAVFLEAQDRDSVLCLDEADSLLGKRGEIRQGTDRYANLEVSYLLQRLEEHPGLIVMASNHKENIDPAFIRRFQTILQFPRPGPLERAKIWKLAFPENAAFDLEYQLKIDDLARLDMTGAAIVESARTAALLAAKAMKPGARATIGLKHVADAIKRQFLREARVLSARELKLLGDEA
jgi:hypothetical protein